MSSEGRQGPRGIRSVSFDSIGMISGSSKRLSEVRLAEVEKGACPDRCPGLSQKIMNIFF